MIAFFANIFGYILNFIYNFVGNYGLAIILFSILVKIVMIPISIKQQKTMKKSTKIQSKMKEIQVKYKNNPEQLNQATMELYKSESMSPFSGCLSAIVQLILLFSVFYLVKSPLTYMKKIDNEVISKYSNIIQQYELGSKSAYAEIDIIREIDNIEKLKAEKIDEESEENNSENTENDGENIEKSNEEKIAISEINTDELNELKLNMNFLDLNLAQVPTKSSDWKAYIIPFLYVVMSIISMKITTATTKTKKTEQGDKKEGEEEFDPMAQMNKNMSIMFPVMYLAVALVAPLGLALYWLMNSLLIIIERLALNKLLKDEEEE